MTAITETSSYARVMDPMDKLAASSEAAWEWVSDRADDIAAVPGIYICPRVDELTGEVTLRLQCCDPEALAAAARLIKAWAGTAEKSYRDDYIDVTGERDGLRVVAWAVRARVCEQVVVGEETVQVPDPDAPLVTVTRPVTEWRCAPLLEIAGESFPPGGSPAPSPTTNPMASGPASSQRAAAGGGVAGSSLLPPAGSPAAPTSQGSAASPLPFQGDGAPAETAWKRQEGVPPQGPASIGGGR